VETLISLGTNVFLENGTGIDVGNPFFIVLISKVIDKLSVDCIEPYSGIAIDYLSKDFYSFRNGGPNKDVYEFYDRVALNEYKEENLINGGINYVNIPYTVDHCTKNKNGDYVCDDNPSINVRKQRIKTYLDSKINDIL